jgi:hypothetical protein
MYNRSDIENILQTSPLVIYYETFDEVVSFNWIYIYYHCNKKGVQFGVIFSLKAGEL